MNEKISKRKQNWVDFVDLSSDVDRLLVVECSENMPERPLLWWENKKERIQWAYERFCRQTENMEWLDDNTVPNISVITGTELFAEAFGCSVHKPLDNTPCAIPLVNNVSELYKVKFPKFEDTNLYTLFEMADALKEKCGKDALIAMFDIQTPMDIAALIWEKSDFFVALYEEPEAIKELTLKIKEFMFSFIDAWFNRYGKEFIAHYPQYYMPFGITVSEDEIGTVNPAMYEEFFMKELHEFSEHYGAIGIHCCAESMHQWDNFKKIPNLKLLNLDRTPEQTLQSYERLNNVAHFNQKIDLDLSKIKTPKKPHVANFVYTDTKSEAIKIVEKFKSKA